MSNSPNVILISWATFYYTGDPMTTTERPRTGSLLRITESKGPRAAEEAIRHTSVTIAGLTASKMYMELPKGAPAPGLVAIEM